MGDLGREPKWITEAAVLAFHLRQLAEHGGLGGVRDRGLLASALARPRNLFAYSEPPADLPALAASYAFGIARNHPFIDGNKRVALSVCGAFLDINGLELEATQEEAYHTFRNLAAGEISEEELAKWIRGHLG